MGPSMHGRADGRTGGRADWAVGASIARTAGRADRRIGGLGDRGRKSRGRADWGGRAY